MRLLLHTAPGLGGILQKQLQSSTGNIRFLSRRFVSDKNDLLVVDAESLQEVLTSRVVEDAFFLFLYRDNISPNMQGLRDLGRVLASTIKTDRWQEAIRCRFDQLPASRRKHRVVTFRPVVRLQGSHVFTRSQLRATAEEILVSTLPRNWRLVEDNSLVEVWITVIDNEVWGGIRLTPDHSKRYAYKQYHVEASLRPSIAAAMVWLSCPRNDDVFLDPFCGAGTILIERALAGRYRLIIGSDKSREAIEVASSNIGPRYKPIELHQWDATRIPLEHDSVDAIVTNPPFGHRYGSKESNKELYPAFLQEAGRILKPDGRLVVVTTEDKLMRHLIRQDWRELVTVKVWVLGMRATIFAMERR